MSGPLRFWLSVAASLGAVALGIAVFQQSSSPSESPANAARSAAPSPSRPGAPSSPAPLRARMATWAATYRENVAPLAEAVERFEADPEPEREGCNALLTAAYNADAEIPPPADPDIEGAFRKSLKQFAEAGTYCLQKRRGLQDTFLLLGRSGIRLADLMLLERYGQEGASGLGEPEGEGSAVGARAVEFAERQGAR